ncbi:diacylglycerol kinase [Moraxella sp. FZLJ2107]|uniref:diacylglycerol kinase n=1 Tax=unclassified Moraxella TaxID=2685852 RepID=UPI00209BE6F0|nr:MULTISPECIES: diacylglycerol kinase [unclassified Moraxella]USZ14572.1 diacylglycerol kinase [Moraxella sp. FZFQ2102]UTO05244.1 diacylglycerol kinase [Moraxella sp. FZLJ2107]UTO21979.1 diacylglycerol kinase [Moraxella sp. FZLJ2109]
MNQKPSYAQDMKGKTGIRRIIKAAGYSIDGFKAAFKSEAAFRQVSLLNILLVIVIFALPFTLAIKMILLLVSALSIIVELFNTGLEAAIDRISDEFHPLSKVAKDVGSAAQMVILTLQFVLWLMALYQLYFT